MWKEWTVLISLVLMLLQCLQLKVKAVDCGGLYVLSPERPEVTIQSPGYGEEYPKNVACQWTVVTLNNQTLEAEFQDFSVEYQTTCQFDKLYLDTSACDFQHVRVFCGEELPQPIKTSGSILCLRFLTDMIIQQRGFQLKVTLADSTVSQFRFQPSALNSHARSISSLPISTCSPFPVPLQTDSVIITPHADTWRFYPPNAVCRWLVLGTAVLQFEHSEGTSHKGCNYDSFVVIEGEESKPHYTFELCGQTTLGPIVMQTPKLIVFSTDRLIQARSFIAKLDFMSLNEADQYYSSSSSSTNFDFTSLTSSTSPSLPTLPSSLAFLSSASSVTTYPTFQTPLEQTQPALAQASPTKSASTMPTYSSAETTPQSNFSTHAQINSSQQYETTETKTTEASASSFVTTTYTTNSIDSEIDSACSGIPSVMGETSGIVSSPGFSSHQYYPLNIKCRWIIDGKQGQIISLAFLHFDLEYEPTCSYDFLEVYQVANGTLSLIGRYCGSSAPRNLTLYSRRLELFFESDRVQSAAGFELLYSLLAANVTLPDCPLGRVHCDSSLECIPEEWVCDTEPDCPLGDDETNCRMCGRDEFTCSDKSCVPNYRLCDGTDQCPHSEDESLCTKINADGLFQVMKSGQWFPVCSTSWSDALDIKALWACADVGQGKVMSLNEVKLPLVSSFIHVTVEVNNVSEVDTASQSALLPYRVVTRVSSLCQDKMSVQLSCEIKECGHRSVHLPQPFVLDAVESSDGQWPWTAAIFSGSFFKCGATLISDHWVVSAGHCIYNMVNSPETTTIRIGHVNIQASNITSVRVSEIINHPDNNYIYDNDIALLRLEHPVALSDLQRPLCLGDYQKDRSPSLVCYVAGWGVLNKSSVASGEGTSLLHHTKLKLWEQTKCQKAYPNQIKPTMLCAGYYSGGMDACKGDSGGPLMCQSRPEQWELVGVVSWGEGCGEVGKPGVYTRVDPYINWIKSVIGDAGKVNASCDFEHPDICGYSSWSGSEFSWSRRSGGVHVPAMPSADTTLKTTAGHYLYAYIPYNTKEKEAVLVSPGITLQAFPSCLQVSVILFQCSRCQLQLQTVNTSGGVSSTLFQISSQTPFWMRFSVDISEPFQKLWFVASSGKQIYGGVGLDDIILETKICPSTVRLNCNFDNLDKMATLNLCQYTQDRETDEFDWSAEVEQGDTNTSDIDMFLRGWNTFGYLGYRARLKSPEIADYVPLCLSFRYRISSASAGSLQLCKQFVVSGSPYLDCSIWSSRSLGPQPGWGQARVSVVASTVNFSLVFEMVQGQGQGYVDLDDIVRQDGDCV
ncbi:atrial natriuretic peptide-converting enzyme [Biomphalaria pfeifferi]|uniref:Atrial natriuretic peptide-converting enzyme n=1 Tax=Biomphalaria pfeifferi TaxID=112525 RepID=A0AAD8BR88_BIOPF|nr:atrial natriuretic peptide-converting enzyme [Biomphalaria pfeifferi]